MPRPLNWLINSALFLYFGTLLAIFLWPFMVLTINALQPAINSWYKLWLG
jgi:hypothetical protein